MKELYAFEFKLEDFGQNVSHLVRKTYYTHDFFTDRQVYAGITLDFLHSNMDDSWRFKRVSCTLAIPLDVSKTRRWYSVRNTDYQKESDTGRLTYVTEGYQEYLCPGSKFLAFSFLEPKNVLFIGKKGALARIERLEKVNYTESRNAWTSLDLIYTSDYEERKDTDISEIRLRDASQRFLVGNFKATKALKTTYDGNDYSFYSLYRYLKEQS